MGRIAGFVKLARLSAPFAVGVAVGLLVGCLLPSSQDQSDECAASERSAVWDPLDDEYRDEQYEPRLVTAFQSSQQPERSRAATAAAVAAGRDQQRQPSLTPVRTRYASVELDIKETTIVGILTSQKTLRTRAVALNRSLAHVVPKLLFFALSDSGNVDGGDQAPPLSPPDLHVVYFPSSTVKSLPLRAIKHMADNYGSQYAFFALFPDVSYVRGRKLLEFLRSCNVNDEIYAGSPFQSDARYCDLRTGIVLSRTIAVQMASKVFDACIAEEGRLPTLAEVVGKCVLLASNIACSSKIGEHGYTVVNIDGYPDSADLTSIPDFNNSVAYHPVSTDRDIYRLHRAVCGVELAETQAALRAIKEEIVANSQLSNGSVPALSWPTGVPPRSKVSSRFDVIQWTYFTEEGFYVISDTTNFQPMNGMEREEIKGLATLAVQEFNSRARAIAYELVGLQNGYRRFDPARGQEYILDIIVNDLRLGRNITRRAEVILPLTLAEIQRMPPVRMVSLVNVVLLLRPSEEAALLLPRFLDYYEKSCMPSKERPCRLFAVVVIEEFSAAGNSWQHEQQQQILDILQGRARINCSVETIYLSPAPSARSSAPRPVLAAARAISAKLSPDALMLTATVGTRLDTEFLTVARQYAVRGSQVYAPIGFWEYSPDLVYGRDTAAPESPNIVKDHGHFDADADEHAAFYAGDFRRADRLATYDSLLDVFSYVRDLYVFRPVEPLLKVWHTEIVCPITMSSKQLETCSRRRAFNLADKSRLASLVLEKVPSLGDS